MNLDPSLRDDSPDAPEWQALARYLAGESGPEEVEVVRLWLAAEPGRQLSIEKLDQALSRVARSAPAVDVARALQQVLTKINERDVIPLRPRSQPTPRWRTAAIRLAAAIVVLVGAGLLYRQLAPTSAPVALAAAASYQSDVGQSLPVRLSDGTEVILGPTSRLTVREGYGASTREIELDGEALFTVVHDDERPFVVHAGVAVIRDLGTVFAVRTDAEAGVRVVVTEGSVVLQPATRASGEAAPSSGVTLLAGDRGLLAAGGAPAAERGVAVEDDLDWTRGQLVFEEAPLTDVALDLQRWYGITLRFAQPDLAGRHLTASFAGEPVNRILAVIELALGADIELRGDTAIVSATSALEQQQ